MLRGVRIDSHNSTGIDRFRELTHSIDLASYDWSVGRVEMYHAHGGSLDTVPLPDIVDGSRFQQVMEQVNYVIFGRFIGYPPDAAEPVDLLSYGEFAESSAQLGMLVVDADYYDFYVKDAQFAQKIAEAAENLRYNVEYIDENDLRLNWDI